jgi:putative phage-type endonuclease
VINLVKKILDKRNMTSEDWQEYRRKQKGIGGSDCAVILGLSPYKSAFELWLEKTGQIEPKNIQNEYVEWGNILEPVIRDQFKKVTGFKVFQNNFVLQHDTFEFMIANIDGEVIDPAFNGERGILEIKTASERMKDQWIDGPPYHYMLQIQHYLGTLGYSYAYVACLIGGNHFKYFKILRDDYVIDKIISAEKEFMRMVEENIAPEITGQESDSRILADSYPEALDSTGELSADDEAFTLRYIELQEEINSLQKEVDYIKNRLKLKAKDHKILEGPMFRISMPTIRKVSFDSKTFSKDYPDLYEKYKTKETTYRSFNISDNRGK